MSTRRLLVLMGSLVALAAPATARADIVTDWNANASNAFFNVPVPPQAPNVGVLHLAMVQGAVYDAVNAITRTHQAYLYTPIRRHPNASKEAAAATAAFRVIASIVPAQQASLQALYNASLASLPAAGKAEGITLGEAAAAAMIDARTGDGRFGAPGFPVGFLPGQWKPVLPAFVNDPNAWVRNVKPFMIQGASQFRSPPPFALNGAEYAAEFNEVKSVGSLTSTTRTAFQTNSALYWAENSVRTWNRIVRTLVLQQGLSIDDSARLLAMVTMSQADAIINVWDDKGYFLFWRPIQAIREADTDGNPATAADPAWLPFIATPPYPDHSSGANCLSGAATRTLRAFFGTDTMMWTDTNQGGQTRSFLRFSDARAEVVDTRVWAGIHFRRADEAGARIGEQVADWMLERFFQPNRGF